MQISIKALYGHVNGDVSESIHSTSVLIIGQKFISIMHFKEYMVVAGNGSKVARLRRQKSPLLNIL